MNPRDIILEALWGFNREFDSAEQAAAELLAELAKADYVIVKCGPLGRVVVDRTSKPCADCDGYGVVHSLTCSACGGSGVVEATTTITPVRALGSLTEAEWLSGALTLPSDTPLFAAVALPEETPHD